MFERLARQEEREGAVQKIPHDVFKEATNEELRNEENSEPNETKQTSHPVTDQLTSSTEINGQKNKDVEMEGDEKGEMKCRHQAKNNAI